MELKKKQWESDFFSKKIGVINYEPFDGGSKEFSNKISSLLKKDKANFDLIELNLNSRQIALSPIIEDLGFRLTDSKISFLTKIDQNKFKSYNISIDKEYRIRLFTKKDTEKIKELTINNLVNDSAFVSKYKSEYFFDATVAEKYFNAWIEDSVKNQDSIISVLEKDNEIIGYFIYKFNDWKDGLKVYKGILTTVKKEFRGRDFHLALQEHIFENIKDKTFYIDNTTQISNIPIIRNHIKSSRYLNSIYLIYLWKKKVYR